MPSTWDALTSALFFSRAATRARSFFSAASANGALPCPSAEPLVSNNTTNPAANSRFFGDVAMLVLDPHELKQLIHLPPAIAKRVEPHAHLVEQCQVQVGQRRRLGEADVAAAFHLAGGAARHQDPPTVV